MIRQGSISGAMLCAIITACRPSFSGPLASEARQRWAVLSSWRCDTTYHAPTPGGPSPLLNCQATRGETTTAILTDTTRRVAAILIQIRSAAGIEDSVAAQLREQFTRTNGEPTWQCENEPYAFAIGWALPQNYVGIIEDRAKQRLWIQKSTYRLPCPLH